MTSPPDPSRALSQRIRRQTTRTWYEGVMKNRSCADCGETRRATLEWHHTDPRLKDSEVSRLISNGSGIPKIQREMAKCIVLCANCHKLRHSQERADAREERRKAA
jgi:hypothetical protein